MSRKSDIELVKAAQSGDTSAYNDLVRRHQAGIKFEMTGLLSNVHDAEDVTQDAFLRAYLKLSSLKSPYNFGGWVRQIARNMARNLLTRGPRFVPLEQQHTIDESDSAPEQSNNYLPDQVEQTVLALSRLSSRLRETARLSYLSDYSHRQIAERLRIPVGTVKRRLWEGRSQIRKEVINMSGKGKNTEPLMTVPDIRIHELPEEQMGIKVKGPGLYFGSLLQVGHQEVCRFFDYPGGILTQTVQTHVIRKVNILSRECFEVLIEHSDCEPPGPNLLDYFQVTDQGINWIMRITSDVCYPQTRFMKENEEVFPVSYSIKDKKNYCARVVNLTVGNRKYGQCLAVFWSWQDGTPAESFYTAGGRQVLHRRYVGKEAPASRNYDYTKLTDESEKVFHGKDYRLWYDTVLMES